MWVCSLCSLDSGCGCGGIPLTNRRDFAQHKLPITTTGQLRFLSHANLVRRIVLNLNLNTREAVIKKFTYIKFNRLIG